jgi:small subunit ribosomal protein S4e
MLSKLGGTWAPRPSTGPHKLRACLPVCLILRNRLKYALTGREAQMICMRRNIKVDGKVRTDMNYPAGFMDVVTIERSNESFRLLYDTKGRFTLTEEKGEAAQTKLLRVVSVSQATKATSGRNPFAQGQGASIPYITTHDGRTIRYPDPEIKVNDTVKFNFVTNQIVGFYKFTVGKVAMITKGANQGRVGVLLSTEKHPGGFNIVHLKDKRGHDFSTRQNNVFILGNETSEVALPKGNGIKLSIQEETERRQRRK